MQPSNVVVVDGDRVFRRLLANTLVTGVTSSFVWFALTFWVYLETRSVVATGVIGGAYSLCTAVLAPAFGTYVDRHRKHTAMVLASTTSALCFVAATVVFVTVDAASAAARGAMAQYFDELARRLPGGFVAGDALDEAGTDFNPPRGAFVVAHEGDDVVGCGALALLDETTAEVKRMWIHPSRRGSGLGRRLLQQLEAEARRAGATVVVLDTNGALTEAVALYESSGYAAVAPYNDNPDADHWFQKALGA